MVSPVAVLGSVRARATSDGILHKISFFLNGFVAYNPRMPLVMSKPTSVPASGPPNPSDFHCNKKSIRMDVDVDSSLVWEVGTESDFFANPPAALPWFDTFFRFGEFDEEIAKDETTPML